MKKENVNPTLTLLNAKLSELKEDRENNLFIYITRDKFLVGHGYVNELNTVAEIVDCQKSINGIVKAQTSLVDDESIQAMKELGIEDNTIVSKPKPVRILGFPVKYWNDDLKTRLREIQSDAMVVKLTEAKSFLEANMSEEDKNADFNAKLESITGLLK